MEEMQMEVTEKVVKKKVAKPIEEVQGLIYEEDIMATVNQLDLRQKVAEKCYKALDGKLSALEISYIAQVLEVLSNLEKNDREIMTGTVSPKEY